MKPFPTTEAQIPPAGAPAQRRKPRVVAVIVPRRPGDSRRPSRLR